jgi:transposase InsO family protein
LSDRQKDIQILLLRQQLRVLQRKARQPKRFSRFDKTLLSTLVTRLRPISVDFGSPLAPVLIFKPETVLKGHRELVKRKWTFKGEPTSGRPKISPELEQLILQLAHENSSCGYDRIEGELRKLGDRVDRSTIRTVLKRHRTPPATKRRLGSSWRTFLRHYQAQVLACDCFTVETLGLKTLYGLFFIEIGTRRLHVAGCTEHPTSLWVTQPARQICWKVEDQGLSVRSLIHDRDSKFTAALDRVFSGQQIRVIHTPVRAPNANAYAVRCIRSIRQECLDHLIILNRQHLERVMWDDAKFYHQRRPHQGLENRLPEENPKVSTQGSIQRRDLLGGIIHDYYRKVA